MKRILFIDRDGVVLEEPPLDFQIDDIYKTSFVKGALTQLSRIASEFDFYKVMVTNQDGLGTDSYPESQFYPYHDLMIRTLASVGFVFDEMIIDKTFASDNQPTRKPGTALLTHLMNNPDYDLANSFVIGDRITDVQLAKNLGCKAIWMNADPNLGLNDTAMDVQDLRNNTVALETTAWKKIYEFLKLGMRVVQHERNTKETQISVALNLDGSGKAAIQTGLGFFDHMLDQIARHGNIDLAVQVKGDLHIDEHHTIEDTGIALGEAFAKGLADKRGMERYGFCLPMDDCEAQVSIDFGGRNWIVWEAEFKREKIGDMPTEMFFHFFKSFSDASKCNLIVRATGSNEHHKIEAIFKAFAKAIKMAVKREPSKLFLPSTKGVL